MKPAPYNIVSTDKCSHPFRPQKSYHRSGSSMQIGNPNVCSPRPSYSQGSLLAPRVMSRDPISYMYRKAAQDIANLCRHGSPDGVSSPVDAPVEEEGEGVEADVEHCRRQDEKEQESSMTERVRTTDDDQREVSMFVCTKLIGQ